MNTKTSFMARRQYTRSGKPQDTFGDFVCQHCGAFVSADAALSGVRSRNHCPYCLSSRHLDQFEAGDRLSACKASMKPIGLTRKRVVKKYAGQGELMLVHECEGCGKVSINRIAADDDSEKILAVLKQSASLNPNIKERLAQEEIDLLSTEERAKVQCLLLGQAEAREFGE